MTFLTSHGLTRILRRFNLVQFRKVSSNFTLSDAEENASGPLNREGKAALPLLRTLLAICQSNENEISCK